MWRMTYSLMFLFLAGFAPLLISSCNVLQNTPGEPGAVKEGAGHEGSPPPEAAAPSASSQTDRFGVLKLYPTIEGGREWHCAWDNGIPRTLASGARDPWDEEFIARGDGSVAIGGDGIAVMSGAAPRMYVYDEERRKKWLNVETTFYGKRIREQPENLTYRGFVAGTRSEHQDADVVASGIKSPCKGASYYGKILYDGRVVFQKEIIHHSWAGYSVNKPKEGDRRFWDTPDRSMPAGVWIGYKFVVRNVDSNQHVQLELYRDMTDGLNGGRWEKLVEYKDEGGWTNPKLTQEILMEACLESARPLDEILLKPGTATFIRNDGIEEAQYKKFSIREIKTSQTNQNQQK